MWEFSLDTDSKRFVNMKFFALDNILGFIGGLLNLFVKWAGILMLPFGVIEFTVNNSTKLEEIEL